MKAGFMEVSLCVIAGAALVAAILVPAKPIQIEVRRCPDYPGQRIVSSRITLATGEVACVYAPEQPRR